MSKTKPISRARGKSSVRVAESSCLLLSFPARWISSYNKGSILYNFGSKLERIPVSDFRRLREPKGSRFRQNHWCLPFRSYSEEVDVTRPYYVFPKKYVALFCLLLFHGLIAASERGPVPVKAGSLSSRQPGFRIQTNP